MISCTNVPYRRKRAGGERIGRACSRIATESKLRQQKRHVPPEAELRTHKRIMVASGGDGAEYGSSMPRQHSA